MKRRRLTLSQNSPGFFSCSLLLGWEANRTKWARITVWMEQEENSLCYSEGWLVYIQGRRRKQNVNSEWKRVGLSVLRSSVDPGRQNLCFLLSFVVEDSRFGDLQTRREPQGVFLGAGWPILPFLTHRRRRK